MIHLILTCNQISDEPLQVVEPDPMQEGEEAVYIMTHLLRGRSIRSDPITCSWIGLNIDVRRIADDWVTARLELNPQDPCQAVADFGRHAKHLRENCLPRQERFCGTVDSVD